MRSGAASLDTSHARDGQRRAWPRAGLAALALALLSACRTSPTQEQAASALAPAAAPPPAAAGAAPGPGDLCPSICERSRALGCKRLEGCVASCREMRQVPTCAREMTAVLSCLGREPLTHWECNDEGAPAIKDGYCDDEQRQFVACVQSSAGGPPAR